MFNNTSITKSFITTLLLTAISAAHAQRRSDTAALIREFDKVTGFAIQPNVHFTAVVTLRSGPMLPAGDTGRILHAEFYKSGDDLYYGTEAQEMYLEDSLMVKVDHVHKLIQIDRVDVATKKNLDVLPLKKKEQDRMFRSRYIITPLPDQGDTSGILFRSVAGGAPQSPMGTAVRLLYSHSDHLPLLMETTVSLWQQETEAVRTALRSSGFNLARMTEEKDGLRALVMTQTTSLQFLKIELSDEQARQIPVWTRRLTYNPSSGNYTATGNCAGYRVIKAY